MARFYDVYFQRAELPKDITKQQWRKAVDTFRSQGPEALEQLLAGEEWGTIGKGYTPMSVLKASIRGYHLGPTAFSKGHIQTREGIYLPGEKTVFQRFNSYAYQILGLTRLRPYTRSFVARSTRTPST